MHTHVLVRPVGLLLLLATLAVCGAFASSASAAVPGLQRVVATSASNSLSKSVIATCPLGKRLIGTGGDITGGLGQVVIDDLTPNATLTRVTVTGFEDEDGTTANWSPRAYAICANPLPGLQLVVASSLSTSSSKSVTATCPLGKRLIGTGGDITGGLGQVVIDDLAPNATLTAVTVTGFEDDTGTTANWSLRAYAICASPLPGLERIVASSLSNSSSKSVTATCSLGKRLTGLGGDITGGLGQVVMDDLTPNATLTAATVTGFEDDNGTTANWSLRAYAICATP